VNTPARSGAVEPVGYAELLEQVKVRVRTSRVQAARAVNTELVGLYWQIGRLILGRQESPAARPVPPARISGRNVGGSTVAG